MSLSSNSRVSVQSLNTNLISLVTKIKNWAINKFATKTDVDTSLALKQDKLTANNNISISDNNEISAINVVTTNTDQYIDGQKTFTKLVSIKNAQTTGESNFRVLKPNGTNNERFNMYYHSQGQRGLWDSVLNKNILNISSADEIWFNGNLDGTARNMSVKSTDDSKYYYNIWSVRWKWNSDKIGLETYNGSEWTTSGVQLTAYSAEQATKDGSGNVITDTYPTKTDLSNALSYKQDSSSAVKTFGAQSIAGVKTFTNNPSVKASSGTSSLQVIKTGASSYLTLMYRADGSRGIYDSAISKDIVSIDTSNKVTFKGDADTIDGYHISGPSGYDTIIFR